MLIFQPLKTGELEMVKTLKSTFTGGRCIDVLNPTPEMVNIHDICAGLCHINRFDGQANRAISVALHSLHVFNIVRKYNPVGRMMHLHALLHDAHEYAIGDITTPVKNAIEELAGEDHVQELKKRWDQAIYCALEIPSPDIVSLVAIRAADKMALEMEYRNYFDVHNWAAFGYEREPETFSLEDAQRDFNPAIAGEEYSRILIDTLNAVRLEIDKLEN